MCFNFLFKYKKITFLGRSGIVYLYNKNKYYIDSEMLVAPPYDVIIFEDSIRYEPDNNFNIENSIKNKIVFCLKKDLEKKGLIVEIG